MDGRMEVLARAREQIQQCMKCGNCQAVCPLYLETRHEGAVARGKIRMAVDVLEGRLQPTAELEERFGLCLTCKACEKNCPCGVKCVEIILAARAALAATAGLPAAKKLAFAGLRARRLFDGGLRLGAKMQGLALKRVPAPDERRPSRSARFPIIGLDMRRVIPELAAVPLRDQYEEFNPAYGKAERTVAFFTGCVNNYVYTDAGRAIVEVLRANGCNVVLPMEQHCCGAPVYTSGDLPLAVEMAEHNLAVFAEADRKYGLDHVVFACGTCVVSFAEQYPHGLPLGAEAKARAEALAAKSTDVHPLLVEIGALEKPMGRVERKVTYHDSCHLARSVHVTAEPRQVLKAIPGVEFVEMKDADRCCGGAGSFSLTHYDLSRAITAKKAASIRATGADTATTGCPGCRMTIEDGLAQARMDQPTVHPAMLLYEAYVKAGTLKP